MSIGFTKVLHVEPVIMYNPDSCIATNVGGFQIVGNMSQYQVTN